MEQSETIEADKLASGSLDRLVNCVGDGGKGGGCGYRGGRSGFQCPECGGMLLSSSSIADAIRLAATWTAEEAANIKMGVATWR